MRTMIALTFFLTGCTDIVEDFKNEPSQYYPTFTNSQLFTNKNFCEMTDWTARKDERGRDLVQLECTMNSPFNGYKTLINKTYNEEAYKLNYQIKDARKDGDLYVQAAKVYENVKNIEDLKKLKTPENTMFYNISCMKEMEKMSDSVNNGDLIADDVIYEQADLCADEIYEWARDYDFKIRKYKHLLEKIATVKKELYNEVPKYAYLYIDWVVTPETPAKIVGATFIEDFANGQTIKSRVNLDRVLAQAAHTTMEPHTLTRYLTANKFDFINNLKRKITGVRPDEGYDF